MSAFAARIAAWANRNMPRREDLEHTRFIGPFARRPELWRFTRRSVPRGAAVGLLVGIFALIPGIQILGAALMCVPSRGNIPIATLMTFLSNPATTPFILAASIYLGNKLGFHADISTFNSLMDNGAGLREWAYWMLSDAAPALLVGLFIISTVTAAIGYLVASVTWNWWVRHKRRVKLEQLLSGREPS
ncbi:DUF2062 domain-containing protein [Novosphingobium sp.]|uniref:DUF2062 domain-containing protein n=1 Tax=Novosphingobium sp. TaxID=1874826 RepID=UPI0027365996|nr:DUF2062 domain-containing protein [Novosphingobium sp.]MDP3905622.1 DUF2062 domain-containing protein [Novosphingobium sp.]